jgi:hypothetical protein
MSPVAAGVTKYESWLRDYCLLADNFLAPPRWWTIRSMEMKWLDSIMDRFVDPSAATGLAVTLLCLLLGSGSAALCWKTFRTNSGQKQPDPDARAEGNVSSTPSSSSGVTPSSDNHPVDVWAERRQRGIAAAEGPRRADSSSSSNNKPFGSQYYYAHNSSNAASGGYKDGLRMEDYAMNGPRLLSKNGQDMRNLSSARPAASSTATPASDDSLAQASSSRQQSIQTTATKRVLPVTKYLWDDDGTDRMATIRIDKLPGGLRSTDPPLAWAQVPVTELTAELTDTGGVRVEIVTQLDWNYRLEIVQLYGKVVHVQATRRPKRLLVKLTKPMSATWAAKPWPHPHKKVS